MPSGEQTTLSLQTLQDLITTMRELLMRDEEQRMNGMHRRRFGRNGTAAEELQDTSLTK